MDKLAEQLKRDADDIKVRISDELDHRIEASLRSVTPEVRPERPPARPAGFWWASSLTGIAAAAAVIVIINSRQAEPPTPAADDVLATVPSIDWQTETASLTGPLQQELENLRSDLEKAEKKVREDIGL